MSRFTEPLRAAALAAGLLAAAGACAGERFPGVGRPATPAEVQAWDIDVRPDFKGLPSGRGTVAQGQVVWDAKCASCHGTFGESNEVFPPLVGGTSPDDVARGRVAKLRDPDQHRTTLMKAANVSTLWDYIRRAMPWDRPKSLSPDDVYAVTAYLLHLGDLVPADFELNEKNIRAVQNRLPNRHGLTRDHGLWHPQGKGDVQNTACMKDCPVEARLVSQLPEYARTAHGNLAEQNRAIGPTRGAHVAAAGALPAAPAVPAATSGPDPAKLAGSQGCTACHQATRKQIGPSWQSIAGKYSGQSDATAKLAAKIKSGGSGNWGDIPMPPQPQLKDTEVGALVHWILSGAAGK